MIYVHIGYGKTGTTSIQCFLANNRSKLKNYGIIYPNHPSDCQSLRYKVNSGNGTILSNGYFNFSNNYSYLFSSEQLFPFFLDNNNLNKFIHKYSKKITFIIYTRNLFAHFFSSYNQAIKRNGSTESIMEFANRYGKIYDNFYVIVKNLIDTDTQFRIINYSKNHKLLIKSFLKIILEDKYNLSINDFFINEIKTNRSLNIIELKIQKYLNSVLDKKYSSKFSDFLVNLFPEKKSNVIGINKENYLYIKERNLSKINKINNLINYNQKIKIEEFHELKCKLF